MEQKVKRPSDLAAEFFGTVTGSPKMNPDVWRHLYTLSGGKEVSSGDFIVVSCEVSLVT